MKRKIGKVGTTEVDFVARKNEITQYIQVSASLTDEKTFDREMFPLRAIKDNYPKTLLTLDKFTPHPPKRQKFFGEQKNIKKEIFLPRKISLLYNVRKSA